MQRGVFDKLISGTGAVLVVVLLIAGGLLTWGSSFASNNVHNQLAQQQIYFPSQSEISAVKAEYAKGGQKAVTDPEFPNAKLMIPALSPYAGKQLLTGAEAQAYANDFIGQHLYAMPLHGVYSKVSAAFRAAKPGSKAAAEYGALEATVFQGTTLRGLLLEAYGFGTVGSVMMWGAIASFVGAAVLLILTLLGFRHAAETPLEERVLVDHHDRRASAERDQGKVAVG
ncbi:MAG: hypothetical protein M0T77_13010 [Actinomycetota bacterium]|nr:hypothetical protein [Actinomycetota bacterium]